MVKEVGAALIIAASSGMGWRIARAYRERPRHLRQLIDAMRLLQTEIEFSATPLPHALEAVGRRASEPVGVFFRAAAAHLDIDGTLVRTAFEESIARNQDLLALTDRDFEVVRELANTLGRSDRAHQGQQLAVVIHRLEVMEREAEDARNRNERMWQYLGVLAGLVIVVVLY